MQDQLFNIRVYGIYVNEHNQVLVTDELRFGQKMTKFPGGGLEYGEGLKDGLKRECREELQHEIEIINHFYTTDYFQKSAFDDKQLISIYYLIDIPDLNIILSEQKFFFEEEKEGSQNFRFIEIDKNLIEELTFPIDKLVGEMLLKANIK